MARYRVPLIVLVLLVAVLPALHWAGGIASAHAAGKAPGARVSLAKTPAASAAPLPSPVFKPTASLRPPAGIRPAHLDLRQPFVPPER